MVNQIQKLDDRKLSKKDNRFWLSFLKWLLVAIIVLAVLFFLSEPLRNRSSNTYVGCGDQYLAQKKYLSADLEYQKALILNSNNQTAKDHQKLAEVASKNVEALENFYKNPQYSNESEIFSQATAFPQDAVSAVKLSRELIERDEYQLAIIPAETASEMAPDYKDAWIYLEIADTKTAGQEEISPEAKKTYLDEAQKAIAKVKQIDPEYKI